MYDSKKSEIVMLEQTLTRDEELMKPVPIVGKVDYSGAHEKTDPREIALVRKLDRWIMVSPAVRNAFERCTDFVLLSPCCGACIGSTTLVRFLIHLVELH
jgi:hypothetical protein